MYNLENFNPSTTSLMLGRTTFLPVALIQQICDSYQPQEIDCVVGDAKNAIRLEKTLNHYGLKARVLAEYPFYDAEDISLRTVGGKEIYQLLVKELLAEDSLPVTEYTWDLVKTWHITTTVQLAIDSNILSATPLTFQPEAQTRDYITTAEPIYVYGLDMGSEQESATIRTKVGRSFLKVVGLNVNDRDVLRHAKQNNYLQPIWDMVMCGEHPAATLNCGQCPVCYRKQMLFAEVEIPDNTEYITSA